MLNKILPIYKMTSGCDYHRILLPLGYAGYDFDLVKDIITEKLKGFQFFILLEHLHHTNKTRYSKKNL